MAEKEYGMIKVQPKAVNTGVPSAEAFAKWNKEQQPESSGRSNPPSELQDLSEHSHEYPKPEPYTRENDRRSAMSPSWAEDRSGLSTNANAETWSQNIEMSDFTIKTEQNQAPSQCSVTSSIDTEERA